METFGQLLPPQLVGFVLTLGLSLLIGFEREENRPQAQRIFFGGVRTFPLIGLGGFLMVVTFPDSALPFASGLAVLGALLAVSYYAGTLKEDTGITTEVAALLTYSLGAAAARNLYWTSIAAGVVAVILLQEKQRLESLATRVPRHEVATLVRFLLLTAVVLPIVPNRPFTPFEVNPFKIWLVVVAVCGVSYLSYLVQLLWRPEGVRFLTGILGGAYSSTVTTVVLARQSRQAPEERRGFAGAIVAATGVMYVRLWVLLLLFAPQLASRLAVLFWSLGLVTIGIGAVLSAGAQATTAQENGPPRRSGNPLELTSAFAFAGIFLAVVVATRVVGEAYGGTGLLVMAGVMGAADVDPFILGLTQQTGGGLQVETALLAVVIAAAANNLMKGVYALVFGSPRVGRLVLPILAGLGGASIVLASVLG